MPVKYPRDRESGDQNGDCAPSVPGSIWINWLSSDRIQSAECCCSSTAAIASLWPSGERAIETLDRPRARLAGNVIDACNTGDGFGLRAIYPSDPKTNADAAMVPSKTSAMLRLLEVRCSPPLQPPKSRRSNSRPAILRRAGFAAGASGHGRSASARLDLLRARPYEALERRGRGGFHQTNLRRLALQNRRNHAAGVFPSKARLPVAISYKTAPREKMSLRASAGCPRSAPATCTETCRPPRQPA